MAKPLPPLDNTGTIVITMQLPDGTTFPIETEQEKGL